MPKCIDCGKDTDNKPIFGELLCDSCIRREMDKIEKNVKRGKKYDGDY